MLSITQVEDCNRAMHDAFGALERLLKLKTSQEIKMRNTFVTNFWKGTICDHILQRSQLAEHDTDDSNCVGAPQRYDTFRTIRQAGHT